MGSGASRVSNVHTVPKTKSLQPFLSPIKPRMKRIFGSPHRPHTSPMFRVISEVDKVAAKSRASAATKQADIPAGNGKDDDVSERPHTSPFFRVMQGADTDNSTRVRQPKPLPPPPTQEPPPLRKIHPEETLQIPASSRADDVFENVASETDKYGSIDVMISLHCGSMSTSASDSVWACISNIEGGEDYREGIYAAVKSCRVFLPLINLQWSQSGESILPVKFPNVSWNDNPKIEQVSKIPFTLQS
ncbi:hypothetical protein BC829DRAFT_398999 [Chytridium lagenaria]|nr:hypothetical protein BC829DRAFT_398999 [Chytridium lagenaria]